ncbi:glycosyltransferase family 39 protein [Candidatus Gottesmanbacteria bacterium]|nr:glycosyltransferase family 39 protein [Candidatus Gottesmanbacteria bacterium]
MEEVKSKVKSQKSKVLILGILLIAAYLRLHNISGYMTFLGDEGRDVLVVKRMIVDHKWTLLGPTASVGGFFLGPIYYYFMLPFLWAWRLDPTGPAVMVALFGIATVYLVYRAGQDMFHPWVGVVASALYALSPIVIAYSRSSWNPNIVPFFSLLTIYLLWKYAKGGRMRNIFWAGVSMGIGLQLHYLFLFLFPVVAIWLLLNGRWLTKIRSLVLGGAGFVIGYAPFLLFELRHGFPNTQSVVQFVLAGKDTGFSGEKYKGIVSDVLFRLVGRLVLRTPQPELWDQIPVWQKSLWEWGIWGIVFVGIVLLVGHATGVGFWGLGESDRMRWRRSSTLMLTWGLTVAALFGFYKRAIYDYYFGIWFALPFLLTAFVLYHIKKIRYVGLVISGALVAFFLWWNWLGQPFQYAPNHQLAQAKLIAKEAFDKAQGRPFNFALVTQSNSDHVYRYFFEIWGNPPVTIEPPFKDPSRTTVTNQLIVICELVPCQPLGHPLWEIAGFGTATISGTWRTPFVDIYKLVHLPL